MNENLSAVFGDVFKFSVMDGLGVVYRCVDGGRETLAAGPGTAATPLTAMVPSLR